ncbi:MAG TPA: hypothetical protein VFP72_23160 [Kineosporiaceae bacterium]|nr:hypothetical protein [Kineosporiaceae bacterium]
MTTSRMPVPKPRGRAPGVDDPFRDVVERELRGEATPAEVAMLAEPANVAHWLRVLVRLEGEVRAHIARDRAALDAKKPTPPAPPTREYLAERRNTARKEEARHHFLRVVGTRRDEVSTRIGTLGLTPVTLGSVLAALVNVENLLDAGQQTEGLDALTALIDGWESLAPEAVAS